MRDLEWVTAVWPWFIKTMQLKQHLSIAFVAIEHSTCKADRMETKPGLAQGALLGRCS